MAANPKFSGKERMKIAHPTLRFDNGKTTIEIPKFVTILIKQAIDSAYCDGSEESIYQQIQYQFKSPLGLNEMVMAAIACSTNADKPLGNDWIEEKLRTQFAYRAQIYDARKGNMGHSELKYDPLGVSILLRNRDTSATLSSNEDATLDVENFLATK